MNNRHKSKETIEIINKILNKQENKRRNKINNLCKCKRLKI